MATWHRAVSVSARQRRDDHRPDSRAGIVTERNVDHFCLVANRATVDAIAADAETFRMSGELGVRFGAQGDGWSVYVYDPDDNVVEIRSYDE